MRTWINNNTCVCRLAHTFVASIQVKIHARGDLENFLMQIQSQIPFIRSYVLITLIHSSFPRTDYYCTYICVDYPHPRVIATRSLELSKIILCMVESSDRLVRFEHCFPIQPLQHLQPEPLIPVVCGGQCVYLGA
jgi:hypothetical protein